MEHRLNLEHGMVGMLSKNSDSFKVSDRAALLASSIGFRECIRVLLLAVGSNCMVVVVGVEIPEELVQLV